MLSLREYIQKASAKAIQIPLTDPLIKQLKELPLETFDIYKIEYPRIEYVEKIPPVVEKPPEKVVEVVEVVEKPPIKMADVLPIVIFAFLSIWLVTR